MSKFKLFLVSLVVIIGVLGGCGSEDANDEQTNATNDQSEASENTASDDEKQEEKVTVSITKKKGEETVAEKEIPIEDGAILMDVLMENFEVEEKGGFINSVEGIKADKSKNMFWSISVNDETASVGAGELELSPGDNVNFDLQSWE